MNSALVLGSDGSNNIGAVIAAGLRGRGWKTVEDDCFHQAPLVYELPPQNDVVWNQDALVITLGATSTDPFSDIQEGEILNVIRGSLVLPLLAVRRYVAWITDQQIPSAHVVLIGSYAYRHPFTNGTAYCAAKAGLDMAAKTLAWELTDQGIMVHIVHPHHVEGTPMWEKVQEGVMRGRGWTREEANIYARKDQKLPRPLTPRTIAEIVAWILTEPAADWLVGGSIELSGGVR